MHEWKLPHRGDVGRCPNKFSSLKKLFSVSERNDAYTPLVRSPSSNHKMCLKQDMFWYKSTIHHRKEEPSKPLSVLHISSISLIIHVNGSMTKNVFFIYFPIFGFRWSKKLHSWADKHKPYIVEQSSEEEIKDVAIITICDLLSGWIMSAFTRSVTIDRHNVELIQKCILFHSLCFQSKRTWQPISKQSIRCVVLWAAPEELQCMKESLFFIVWWLTVESGLELLCEQWQYLPLPLHLLWRILDSQCLFGRFSDLNKDVHSLK